MANQRKQTPKSHEAQKNCSLYQAQARRTIAQARQEELKLQEIEGRSVDLALITRSLEGIFVNQRTVLMRLAQQIGSEVDDVVLRCHVMQLVDRRVREALEILSRFDPGDPMEAGEHEDEDEAGGRDGITSRPMKKKIRRMLRKK